VRPARLLLVAALALGGALAASAAVETVRLVPDERAGFRARNLFAFLRPEHNYGARYIDVTTTPPNAVLDLFYVRSNFQKRYEQASAPVRVELPKRSEAGPRDAVNIRAFLDGHRAREVSVRVSSSQKSVHIDLDPLPNRLDGAAHTYLAGRAALTFLTKETPTVRVQEQEGGFRVILSETAIGPDVDFEGVRSPLVDEVEALQLAEDLLVRVKLPKGVSVGRSAPWQLRSRQARDELRNVYVYSVELVPQDGGAAAVAQARGALASITAADVSGCAGRFDARLRERLDAAALSRALAPRGSFTDPYLRAAMKRLGEVSGGRIALLDGSSFDGGSSIELAAAQSQPAEAVGYLALLRTFVAKVETPEQQRATLRGLVAPELDPARFGAVMEDAERAERQCLAAR
jgi:hypothetical protein